MHCPITSKHNQHLFPPLPRLSRNFPSDPFAITHVSCLFHFTGPVEPGVITVVERVGGCEDVWWGEREELLDRCRCFAGVSSATVKHSPQFHPYTHDPLLPSNPDHALPFPHAATAAAPSDPQQPGAPSGSSSFLSPLSLPSLSLAAAPDQPRADEHAVKGEGEADDALRSLIKAEDADGSLASGDARASTSAAGPAQTTASSSTPMPGLPSLPSFMPPSFANIAPDISGSLAPQSTYIAAPPSSSSAAAALSGSLAAAAAQYGLSPVDGEGSFSTLPLGAYAVNGSLQAQAHQAAQAAFANYQLQQQRQVQAQVQAQRQADDDAASGTTASDAEGSDDEEEDGVRRAGNDEDEPSICGVAGCLLRGGAPGGGAEDYLTPATSAHQSDVEGKPSPASGAPTPAASGSVIPSSTTTPSTFGFAPPPPPQPAPGGGEGYNPGDPYIPSLGAYYAHLGYGHLGVHPAFGFGAQEKITYREDDPPELPYQSDDSADGDFGTKKGRRGRQRTRKASAVPGFAAPKPPPSATGAPGGTGTSSATPTPGSSLDRTARGGSSTPSSSTSRGRKRASPAAYSEVHMPGAIDPATGLARRQTEIPAVEDDPSVKPYGCNWCVIDRAERRRVEREVLADLGGDSKGKGRAEDDGSDVDAEGEDDDDAPPRIELSWRTIKELREHNARYHKDRAEELKTGDEESLLMEMPFRCALDPCDKTFKSLAGLRFHFQNASANGHFIVALERDDQTGQERATKKFKQEVKPSGRELQCPIARCPKKFKQSAGLAYHLTHTPNHPVTAALLDTFESTLLSKTKWWLSRLNKPLDAA
uniref:BY PROTMAP: gi/342319422/gb/EGU11371.1/ Proteophosphoglycan ppg4 [Rhodotorula glutinis ATCC 204091] n=1 Tax=Rhodotorula toruloides TaxID=5286 RepID=A0A0K3CJQ4_RHOTO